MNRGTQIQILDCLPCRSTHLAFFWWLFPLALVGALRGLLGLTAGWVTRFFWVRASALCSISVPCHYCYAATLVHLLRLHCRTTSGASRPPARETGHSKRLALAMYYASASLVIALRLRTLSGWAALAEPIRRLTLSRGRRTFLFVYAPPRWVGAPLLTR